MFKNCVKPDGLKFISLACGTNGDRCLVVQRGKKQALVSGVAKEVYKDGKPTGYMIRERKDGTIWAYTYKGSITRPVLLGIADGLEEGYTVKVP